MRLLGRGALLVGAMIVVTACQQQGGDLESITSSGTIRVSTDANYAPQSFLNDQGEFEGFDIDVSKEIAKRLGVDVEFKTPTFDLVQAGGWNGQWDLSVGSITVTESRKEVLNFTAPYYYTPAQMAATEASGITTSRVRRQEDLRRRGHDVPRLDQRRSGSGDGSVRSGP